MSGESWEGGGWWRKRRRRAFFFFLVEVKEGRVGERGRQIFSLACDSTVKTLLMLMCIRSEPGKY